MSEHLISLPADVYTALLEVAQSSGMSPVEWIVAHLPVSQGGRFEQVSDLIGAIDSRDQVDTPAERTTFGEIIAEKLAKQGIHRP